MTTFYTDNKINNFDLIRLFAAFQVAFVHSSEHLDVSSYLTDILTYVPGVPIFFFISGFLIYQSWSNIKTDKVKNFFKNRFLRIYPALFVCFLVSIASVYFSGYFSDKYIGLGPFLIWCSAQITLLQFYNPDFMRGYGVGVLNGSLWTISVEVQFYFMTPFIFLAFNYKRWLCALCIALFAVFYVLNSIYSDWSILYWKMFGVSFIPWIWMFMWGAYVSTNKKLIDYITGLNFFVLLAAYVGSDFVFNYIGIEQGNNINPASYIMLTLIIINVAYNRPTTATRLLKKNDISYGVYIYHMPIVNLMLFFGVAGTLFSQIMALIITFCAASISWFAIEKHALKLKSFTLRAG